MSVKDKSIWILIVFIFSGLVIGGLLATGALMMYSESEILTKNKKKLMKKGKKLIRTLENW